MRETPDGGAGEGGNCVEPYRRKRGVTQGDPLPSTIFNVVVDAVVRY